MGYRKFCTGRHHGITAASVLLTHRQRQLIMGTLLGDGCAAMVRNRTTKSPVNARLRIRHSTKRQLKYCQWKHRELASITSAQVLIRDTPQSFGKQIAAFSTLSHSFILEQAIKLYVPKKTVTREYLDQLDDFGLAVWWMDDGSTSQLSTHSFTLQEQELICRWLLERWAVDARPSPDRKRNLWFISFTHPKQIHRIVAPHVLPSLRYKFGRYGAPS
jgi:hypothetical protein